MLADNLCGRVLENKKQNSATKIKLELGHIEQRNVRCGKLNCKCARGQRHTAFYHVWMCDGVRYRRYVRRANVAEVKQACDAHRELQSELRMGRRKYQSLLRQAREILSNANI